MNIYGEKMRLQWAGAIFLAMVAGYLDGYGLLFLKTYVSFMSGNTTSTGVMSGSGNYVAAFHSALAIIFFVTGSFSSRPPNLFCLDGSDSCDGCLTRTGRPAVSDVRNRIALCGHGHGESSLNQDWRGTRKSYLHNGHVKQNGRPHCLSRREEATDGFKRRWRFPPQACRH